MQHSVFLIHDRLFVMVVPYKIISSLKNKCPPLTDTCSIFYIVLMIHFTLSGVTYIYGLFSNENLVHLLVICLWLVQRPQPPHCTGGFRSWCDILRSRVSLPRFRILPEGEQSEISHTGQCRILWLHCILLICTLEDSLCL